MDKLCTACRMFFDFWDIYNEISRVKLNLFRHLMNCEFHSDTLQTNVIWHCCNFCHPMACMILFHMPCQIQDFLTTTFSIKITPFTNEPSVPDLMQFSCSNGAKSLCWMAFNQFSRQVDDQRDGTNQADRASNSIIQHIFIQQPCIQQHSTRATLTIIDEKYDYLSPTEIINRKH